jgi:RNA polymerase sigma-70 factor (ECF subfamily)
MNSRRIVQFACIVSVSRGCSDQKEALTTREAFALARLTPTDDCNPERWLDDHADALFCFAFKRIGRRDVCEDLVQETFVAALKSRERFSGRSNERTWLIGILKHKTVDYLRRRSRNTASGPETDSWLESLFDERERWKVPPGDWGANPESALERSEFWEVFEDCLRKLPGRLAVAFRLRAVEDQSSEVVCKELHASATNLWVMLHRARLRLSKCMDTRWFGREGQE